MSGLLFFGSDDFSIAKGTKGDIMCTNIHGFSFVLFYSTECVHCQSLIPIFKKLPGTIGGCQFGMINVSTNKRCVQMSNKTIVPIKYVPYMILYINGRPFMNYKGPHDAAEISKFIVEVSKSVQSKQTFSSEHVKEDVKGSIPEYCIAHPKSNKVCYMTFDEAY